MSCGKIMTFSFHTGSLIDEIKAKGDAAATKGQNINLFALVAPLLKDRLSGYEIHYRPGHWMKDGKEFKFILEKNGTLEILFQTKLSDIMREVLKIDF